MAEISILASFTSLATWTVVRVGLGSGKKVLYTPFIFAKSLMSARYTFTATTLLMVIPAPSTILRMFSRAARVCASIPATYSVLPTRIPLLKGSPSGLPGGLIARACGPDGFGLAAANLIVAAVSKVIAIVIMVLFMVRLLSLLGHEGSLDANAVRQRPFMSQNRYAHRKPRALWSD